MKNSMRNVAVPALLVFALFTSPAWAQQSMAPASASSSAVPAKASHAQRRADAVEDRITQLHGQLNITDAQSKQWDAFAQTMRDNAKKADQAFRDRAQKLPTMNAEESMKSYADIAQIHADDMKNMASAMSDLYAVLSPEQKETADTLYRNQPMKRHQAMQKHNMKSSAPASGSSSATPAGN
jgi:periplasmic protein CpxP/Spy